MVTGNTKPTTAFAVIRASVDGYSYIDVETLSSLPSQAEEKAEKVDKNMPQWAKNNYRGPVRKVIITVAEFSVLTDTPDKEY